MKWFVESLQYFLYLQESFKNNKMEQPKVRIKNFPVVCVGGSAGGLEAYIKLLDNLPCDMGVAIVIVNHELGSI